MPRHSWILVGVVTGAALGVLGNAVAADAAWFRAVTDYVAQPIGQIFIRSLLMLVIPIVFSALVVGVCDLDLKDVGRMGGRTLVYTIVMSLIAVGIGLVLVQVFEPGAGVPAELRESARSSIKAAPAPADSSPIALLVAMVPDNVIKAAANGDMIGVIVFSLIFGMGLAQVQTPSAQRLREMIQGIYDVMMRVIDGVLWFAPLGVGALLFTMTARTGVAVLAQLAAYVGVVLLGLGIHLFGTYSLAVWLLGRMSPVAFFRGVRLAMATAFSTASSSATLPTALRVADEQLHLPRPVSRFVLTAGATLNQNGTALFEGVTVLFLAQAYGIDLDLGKQAFVLSICVLAGIGTAGVPAGSLPVIAMILGVVGVPPEGLGLVLGVNRFLDMCRTVLNVTGDLTAAVYVARFSPHASDPASTHPRDHSS